MLSVLLRACLALPLLHLTTAAPASGNSCSSTSNQKKSPSHPKSNQKKPFRQLVVFGDELSDNGNGSWAHGIAGGTAHIYGFNTWTDGPVAVSYLAQLLDIPLHDYAWGGCCGGSSSGSTIDNTYLPAEAKYNGNPIPSAQDQIYSNYTLKKHLKTQDALAVLWIGQNDLLHKTDWFYSWDSKNTYFAANYSSRVLAQAEYLVKKGAPYVLVPNIFPKQMAPVTPAYLCNNPTCVNNLGLIIQNANSALLKALGASKYKSQLIYYDVYSFMMHVMDNKDSYGFTVPLTEFCDGNGNTTNWAACTAGATRWDGAKKYFWMAYYQPTTTVHSLIANDMKAAIDSHLSQQSST